jgi:hypothetical protein
MYKKVVNGIRDLGVIKGATGPHIIECDDGKKYVVKFADRTKTAVNEFVGHALAKAVGLPVPSSSFVELSPDLIARSRDMTYRAISAGLHQGSELVPDVLDFDQFGQRKLREGVGLSNPEVLPGTICHDNWVLTRDRDRGDNHLVQPVDGRFSYLMVDFTHGFTGPSWTADSIEQGSYLRILMPTHPVAAEAVTGFASFRPTLERIEALGDSEIEEVVAAVPRPWGVTEEESLCLINFLELRRGLIRSVLTSNRASFPNWGD